ncbi:MAG: hypothetical protein ABIN89_13085 [Chitinophagaceae bacterium]
MKQCFYVLFVSFFAVFCNKQESQPVEMNDDLQFTDQKSTIFYLIKKGNHYCEQNQPQLMNRNSMSAKVTFDSSAIYTSTDAGNQRDVNKLIGFSDCGNDHQQNSARLGWLWDNNKLVLYAYAYNQKARIIKTLGNFDLNKTINCSIKAEKNYYYFKADSHKDSIPRYCADFKDYRYKLFPYFGGDETAPHEITILIEED